MQYNIKNILINQGLDTNKKGSNIYMNLYESLKKAILNRALDQTIKLPPSRILANDLNISRSTVLKAYELLVLENYVKSIKGSGYYINSNKNIKIHYALKTRNKTKHYPLISKKGLAFQKKASLINDTQSNNEIAFKPGLPPLDVFPINTWKNLTNTYWKTIKYSDLSYSKSNGLPCLRENISNYLKNYRNITCNLDQIIVTTGSLHSLYLIANALINKCDRVLMEHITYPHAYRLFNSLQAKITQVDLNDKEKHIEQIKSKNTKFFYTIPSNQNFLGNKMSMSKRLNLLQWATNNGSLVIEDDYEHEFSNWKNPISSIYSLDKDERVIYLGTFNKLLHPSIRLGYMIVPNYLQNTIHSIIDQSNRFISTETQKVMSMFIEKDYLNKHIRNIVSVVEERKKVFIENFNSNFKNEITLDSNSTGLNILGRFKDKKINDLHVSEYLKQQGIITNPLSKYYVNNPKDSGLVMGYSSVNKKVIKETILKMRTLLPIPS